MAANCGWPPTRSPMPTRFRPPGGTELQFVEVAPVRSPATSPAAAWCTSSKASCSSPAPATPIAVAPRWRSAPPWSRRPRPPVDARTADHHQCRRHAGAGSDHQRQLHRGDDRRRADSGQGPTLSGSFVKANSTGSNSGNVTMTNAAGLYRRDHGRGWHADPGRTNAGHARRESSSGVTLGTVGGGATANLALGLPTR